jgi:hypothetical protein
VVLQQAPTAASCTPSRGGGLWAAALALGVTAIGGIFCSCFRASRKVKQEVRLALPLCHSFPAGASDPMLMSHECCDAAGLQLFVAHTVPAVLPAF